MDDSHIFICYRREDSSDESGRLYDRLTARYGADQVFRDIDTLKPGTAFPARIASAMSASGVVIVMIGRRWLEHLQARMSANDDFVRTEIKLALDLHIDVLPVLVGGATMPSREDLPRDIQRLSDRTAIEARGGHWDSDMTSLLDAIDSIIAPTDVPPVRRAPKHSRKALRNPFRSRGATKDRHGRRHWLATGSVTLILAGALAIGISVHMEHPNEPARHAPTAVPPPLPSSNLSSATASAGVEQVRITFPVNRDDVTYGVNMTGTAVVKGSDQLWVLGYAPGIKRWYFTNPKTAVNVLSNGSWVAFAFLGDGLGADDHHTFTIAAFIVKAQDGAALKNAVSRTFVNEEPPSIVSSRITVQLVCGNQKTCPETEPPG
jgi:hypothetical protein